MYRVQVRISRNEYVYLAIYSPLCHTIANSSHPIFPLALNRGRPVNPAPLLPVQTIGHRDRMAPQFDAGPTCGRGGEEGSGFAIGR